MGVTEFFESRLAILPALLVLLGALNWGLIAAFQVNLVESVFGTGMLTQVIYIAAGISALPGFLWATKAFLFGE